MNHEQADCHDVTCKTCLDAQRLESVVRLETALLDLETSHEGADGAWIDFVVDVDALDVRNVLDLLRWAGAERA